MQPAIASTRGLISEHTVERIDQEICRLLEKIDERIRRVLERNRNYLGALD